MNEYSILIFSKKDNLIIQKFENLGLLKQAADEDSPAILQIIDNLVEGLRAGNGDKDFLLWVIIKDTDLIIQKYILTDFNETHRLYDYQLYCSKTIDKKIL